MSNYKTILKFLIKDMLKRREKKQKLILALLGVVYFCIAMMAVLAVITYSSAFLAQGKSAELVTLILFIDFMLTIIFGIISAISYLFIAKDTEFFKAMPVKQSSVFLAKLTVVYLTEAVLSTAILLPALVTAGIFLSVPVLFYFMIPLFIIVVPIFSLVFIALLSLPFMYLISLFKNRGIISSIALIIVFTVVFGLYMWWMMSSSNMSGDDEINYDGIISAASIISNIFYPAYMFVKFSMLLTVFGLPLAASLTVEALIFLGIFAVISAIAYLLCSLIYSKVTARLLESGAGRKAKNKKYVAAGAVKTLIKTEWRNIMRNPTVAMQVAAGVILCPLIMVFFCLMFGNMGSTITETTGGEFDMSNVIWIMGIISILMFGAGTNSGPASCISREGKSVNLLKTLPLTTETIIKAKRITYFLISMASVLTGFGTMIVMMIIYNAFIWWLPLLGIAVVLTWLWAITNLSIYMDLRRPKLDWKSLREVVKRTKNNLFSIVWIFSTMILGGILFSFVLAGVITNATLAIGIGLGVLGVLGIIAAILFQKLLDKNAAGLFDKLNV